MNRRVLILANVVQSQLVFNVWVGIGLLLLMMILAGCSSVNKIVAGLGANIQADLPEQTIPVTGLPAFSPIMTANNDEADVAALLARAEVLADEGELAAALALADEAVTLAPDSANAHSMRGRILYSLDDLEGALAALDFAVELGMDWPAGYLLLANIHATLGNIAAEIEALDKTIEFSLAQGEGSASSVLMLALQYRSERRAKAGDLPGAIADLEIALSIAPWEYGNFKTLSDLRYRLAARQSAFAEDPTVLLAHLNERLAADPNDLQALLDRGFLALQLAFIDEDTSPLNAAYQDFTAALTLDPTLAEAYHGRALTTWMASDAATDVGGMDIEEILALADSITTLNFQTADADVTITDGTVTMTNTQTGAVTVQSVEEWQMAYAETPVIEDATPESALTDLETAISLAPDTAAARHDRGVMRLRTWFEDGLMTMLMEGPRDSVDEALTAAVSDLTFTAEQSPDWAVARLNRGLARLFEGISLIGVYMASDGDGEIGEAIQSSLDESIADATWLIDQDEFSGGAHYMRLLAILWIFFLNPDMDDPTLAAYAATDYQRVFELVTDFDNDDAVQLTDQTRLSLQIAPPPLISSGALEVSDEGFFYTNADYGLRLKALVDAGNYAAATANGTLWLHMADDFDVLDVLVMQPALGDGSVHMWLADTLLSLMPPGKLVEQPPLQTQYGPAMLFTYQGGSEAVLAILPIGDYVFSFEYAPGPYKTEQPSTLLGFETRPPDVLLAEFIYGLTVDGVVGNQPLDPRLAESIAYQGWGAMMNGDYEEAVRLLRLALVYNPDDAVALNNLAWTLAYDLQTDLNAALGYALRAVKLDPDPSHYDTLGMVYYQLQQYDEALAAYTEALTLDPDLTTGLRGRADVYVKLGEIEKAIQDLEHYLDVEPLTKQADDIRIEIEGLRSR